MRESAYIKRFLLLYAPDFCWMSSLDLLTMMEVVYPDIDVNTFKVTLCRLNREGHFITRKAVYRDWQMGHYGCSRGGQKYQFLRKSSAVKLSPQGEKS